MASDAGAGSVTADNASDPVIVHLLSPSPVLAQPAQPAPRLRRPWPLLALAVLDAAYQLAHALRAEMPAALAAAAAARLAVCGVLCGTSTRWRARGGWVALASGTSILAAVWRGCAGLLLRAVEPQTIDVVYLVTPWPNTYSGRHVQSPTSFRYTTEESAHSRQPSASLAPDDDEAAAAFDAEMGLDSDSGYDSRSESSVSESSIIDMPRPAQPSRIVPPASLSMNALPIFDDAPVVGPLIRRSRSARLATSPDGAPQDYGTF